MEAGKMVVVDYNGFAVSFTDEAWFNATAVAAMFEKKPAKWLELPSTEAYLAALSRNYPKIGQFKRATEGRNGGTWFHPKLSVAFARWLNADFAVWCDMQIEAILRGEASVPAGRPKSSLEVMRAQHAMLGQLMDDAIEARAERERQAAVQVEQAEEIKQVRGEIQNLRESFESQLSAITATPVKEKPSGTESLTKIKALWNERRGLPDWVTEAVLTQVEQFRILPKAYVGKGVRHHRNGDPIARPDGSLIEADAFFAYQLAVVTLTMNRFVAGCSRHDTDKRKAVHPSFPDRPFNLAFGYAKGDQKAA
jgi:hypothetical protein